jgi:hypothetical protein
LRFFIAGQQSWPHYSRYPDYRNNHDYVWSLFFLLVSFRKLCSQLSAASLKRDYRPTKERQKMLKIAPLILTALTSLTIVMSTQAQETTSVSAALNYVAPSDGNWGGTARTPAENAPVTNWVSAPVVDAPFTAPVNQSAFPERHEASIVTSQKKAAWEAWSRWNDKMSEACVQWEQAYPGGDFDAWIYN